MSSSSASEAWSVTLRLLTRRSRSEAELTAALRRKGFADDVVAGALERGRRLGYLDDRRFALERARALMAGGRAVGSRLLAELRRHGVAEETAREALTAIGAEIDEEQVLEGLVYRRFPRFRFAAAPDGERRRVVNYLLRRGFPLAQILEFLQRERQTAPR